MYLLYDLLLLASATVLIPYYLLRGLRHGKMRRGIRERLGFYTSEQLASLRGRRAIWIHAVSVGETRAAIPLVKALKSQYPEHAIILSNVTETGHAIGKEIGAVDLCLFFPFDLSWVVQRVLNQVRPEFILIVETEIWPNFVRLSRDRDIPVILVNGRISDRSFPRYMVARRLLRPVLRTFSGFCMQTDLDAERIIHMGAPSERIHITSNLKFDMETDRHSMDNAGLLREAFRIPADMPVWVAGSTHPGEEEAIVDIYRGIVAEGRRLLLILVPRQPLRCAVIEEMLGARGVPSVRRSVVESLDRPLDCGEVLLVDTLGEMLKFYALADLVFVGGSLVPVGGHNVLEASLVKKAVVFGPYMHNFKEISRLLLAAGGGRSVAGGHELGATVRRLLAEPEGLQAMGLAGYALLQKNYGATDQTMKVIRSIVAAA